MKKNDPEQLVLYDGFCALCNTTVKFLIKIDRKGLLTYAPLQGETARGMLSDLNENEQSVVFVHRNKMGKTILHHRSNAFLAILRELGGVWRLMALLFGLIPRPLRDRIYDLIASRRYRWFGKYEACPLPPSNVRQRFLP